jgi:hypothetical protein
MHRGGRFTQQREAFVSAPDSNPAHFVVPSVESSFCGKLLLWKAPALSAMNAWNCAWPSSGTTAPSFYLRTPDEYRKLARGNVRAAEASGIPGRTWLRLAEESEKQAGRSSRNGGLLTGGWPRRDRLPR